MANIIQSFSYGLKEANIVAEAEDKAKEKGISFSKYIMSLIEQDVKKKKIKQ